MDYAGTARQRTEAFKKSIRSSSMERNKTRISWLKKKCGFQKEYFEKCKKHSRTV
jgi:hypothetical protein